MLKSAYLVYFFSGNIYNKVLKFLQVIYESFDCDLTQVSASLKVYYSQVSPLKLYTFQGKCGNKTKNDNFDVKVKISAVTARK